MYFAREGLRGTGDGRSVGREIFVNFGVGRVTMNRDDAETSIAFFQIQYMYALGLDGNWPLFSW